MQYEWKKWIHKNYLCKIMDYVTKCKKCGLKGLSHEIDFKNFGNNLQNFA
jgi:hypothetical protein